MTEQFAGVVGDAAYDPTPLRRAVTKRGPRQRLERDIVAEVINHLRSLPMGYARKVHGGSYGNTGEPDVDAVVRGRSVRLEAKARVERPTPPQLASLRRWRKAGALTGWFRSLEHVLQLLDHLDEPTFEPDLDHPGCACERHREQR